MKRRFSILVLAYVIIIMMGAQVPNGRLHPLLEQRLKKLPPGERLAVIVELNDQAKPAEVLSGMRGVGRRDKARAVANALRNIADKHQGPLKAHLKEQEALGAAERVIPFWIFNGFAVTGPESLIRDLASRPDVREVRLDIRIPLPSLTHAAGGGAASLNEWNIETVRAPEVWGLDPAYNGTGAVVGSFDTGVDLTHPDLAPRYRGNHQTSWFDPYNEHAVPFDFHGHGTHTTGTAVGGDASGSNIGIAPGAVWIAAKAWDDSGVGMASAFHEIFEWFLAPGGNPDNAPDVVNCSWGFEEAGCDTEFLPDIEAWRAAGIFPAFASGNNGPDPGSVRSPGAYPAAFAVGATGSSDEVADFSSRGPTPCDSSIKPDISAPGDGIVSAVPWGYDIMSGTSMATPHITGAVAVLRSINPALTVDQLESALIVGAKDLGAPGQDNSFGAGRLDLFVSAQIAVLGPDFPVVRVQATDAVATEAGATSAIFTVSRTGNTDSDLEVKFNLGGTATAGSDYESMDESVTIPAGQTSADILVTAIDDLLAEWPETVILTIRPDPAYIVSGSDMATITIQSDELLSDLVVSTLSVPAAGGGAGQSIVLTETTKNQGAGAADPSLTRFYISANSTYDDGDILIGGRSVEGLAAGAVSSGSTTIMIPQETAAGNWYIIAKADGEGTIAESLENNNSEARLIQIGPDLDITALSTPGSTGAGQSIVITDTTKNQGGEAAGPFRIQFFLSTDATLSAPDIVLGTRELPSLAAGASSSASTTVTIPQGTAAGSWSIIAKADSEEAVSEVSERNNTYALSIKIGPDLDITALSAPAAAGAGQSIAISDTTKNQGGEAAGPCRILFFLSMDATLGAADMMLGSRSVPSLAAGASSSASTTVTVPQGTAAGVWYIIAQADGEGAVSEVSETNNTYALSFKVGSDLAVSALAAPATGGGGASIAITDTTKNQGGDAAGPSQTQFFLSTNTTLSASDVLLGSRGVPLLAAGASSSGSTTVVIPPGTAVGNWYIIAKADGEDVVAETSEANNTSAKLIQIGPDLDITVLSAPGTAGGGQSIAIADTAKNLGGEPAGASRTHFFLSADGSLNASDLLLGSRDLPPLPAGASSSGATTVMIPPGTAVGNWYIIAKADGEDAVTEVSETNNTSAKLIQIGPDLSIAALSAPASAAGGQSIAITDTTKNQGGEAAGPSRTRFFLSADTALDASDILLGSRDLPSLPAGGTSSGSTMVMIPQGTAVRTWYIIAKADGEGVVAETSEVNNTSPRSFKII
jgi:subtilase family serine protease